MLCQELVRIRVPPGIVDRCSQHYRIIVIKAFDILYGLNIDFKPGLRAVRL